MKTIDIIKNNFNTSYNLLHKFINDPQTWVNMEKAGDIMVDALNNGGKIISCGNGGSMSDAMHFAEELTGRFRNDRPGLSAVAISDPTHITCVGNDYGFDYIFSRYVESCGKKCDVLLAISTSGNSKNILNAAIEAHQKGMKVIALTGKTGGKLAENADVEFRIPYNDFSDRIQEIHIQIIHSLIHYIESKIFN